MRHILTGTLAAAAMLALAACGGDSGGSSGGGSNDVTLTGSMSASSVSTASLRSVRLSSNPADYRLYCVTFEDPPRSGTGDFDASGNFSVTVQGAAGTPIGCFVNEKATNAPVATLSFQTGTGSGLDDGSSGQATLDSGSYQIAISFDPATGTASADVSQITQGGGTSSLDPLTLLGTWNLACSDSNTTAEAQACQNFLGQVTSVYMDVVSGDLDGETQYAMAPWASQSAFQGCGSTEGLASLPAGMTNVTSLSGNSVTAAFSGITGSANYTRSTNTMAGSDALTWINGNVSGGYDSSNLDPSCPSSPLNLANQTDRACLLDFMHQLAEDGGQACFPRPDSSAWQDFAANGTGATDIAFNAGLGGSPMINGRHDLMELELSGGTGVARSGMSGTYTDYNGNTCHYAEELTVAMTPTSSTKADGRFTTHMFDDCQSQDSYMTFAVSFTK